MTERIYDDEGREVMEPWTRRRNFPVPDRRYGKRRYMYLVSVEWATFVTGGYATAQSAEDIERFFLNARALRVIVAKVPRGG